VSLLSFVYELTFSARCLPYYRLGKITSTSTRAILTMQLAVEIASDVIVTSTIAYCLWKSRTGWSGTDKLIGRLLRYVALRNDGSGADKLGSSLKRNSHLPSCKSLPRPMRATLTPQRHPLPSLLPHCAVKFNHQFLHVSIPFHLQLASQKLTIHSCSPKVYVICLLAVLNSRHSLRKDLSAEQTYTVRPHPPLP
jgi:hypothetical protein